MLIRDAEIFTRGCEPASLRRVDVRIADGRIVAITPAASPAPSALASTGALQNAASIEARGRLLLPGLHDHHIHLASLATALASLPCGPPQVHNAEQLAASLLTAASACSPGQWLRGYGYHATVAGDIDAVWLDRLLPHHPVRIQQRSGRLWLLNGAALCRLTAGLAPSQLPAGLERRAGRLTGRLYDGDAWLAQRLAQLGSRRFPDLRPASQQLAAQGVTGVTDATPANDVAQLMHFHAAQESGELTQELMLMGDASLNGRREAPKPADDARARLRIGPLKLHLHETTLPDFDALVAAIAASHAQERSAAIHCVTVAELVFALNALAAAGAHPGDRIEHAALVPPELLELLAGSTATVVTQPNFIYERGAVYRREVAPADQPWLYRLAGLRAAGVALAGSTDAPFGEPYPWVAMQAAVRRRAADGVVMGADEALNPEAALALFLGELYAPAGPPRQLKVGGAADLCLIDRPWASAREDLAAVTVLATWQRGRLLQGAAAHSGRRADMS